MSSQPDTPVRGLVSIVMPVYNGEAYLAGALESVLAQTYASWELLVVDDGSTDETAAIVARYTDPRVRYTFQENRGQAGALNRGLVLARGEYVTTLDADDCLTPNSLLDRVAYLVKHSQLGGVYADGFYCTPSLEPTMRFSERRPPIEGDVYPLLISTNIFGTNACVMVRTEVLWKHAIRYDDAIVMCQDWDFYIRVAEHAQFGYVDSISVRYRVHPESMTRTVDRSRHTEAIIRTRLKALASPRFRTLDSAHRREFFRWLVVYNLGGRPWDQTALLNSPQLRELPAADRTQLLRWAAAEYLMRGVHLDQARAWLRTAWRLCPRDYKTAAFTLLVTLNARLARLVLCGWRQARTEPALPSPYALAQDARR